MQAADPPEGAVRKPSWPTALSEAEAAQRQLRLATASLERLAMELHELRGWGERMARLETARRLLDGPDGGALALLLAAASDERGDAVLRRASGVILERLAAAIGLSPVAQRGELLKLLPEEVAEFDVRGALPPATDGRRQLYCVVRPGWWVDEVLVARPLVELVAGADEAAE